MFEVFGFQRLDQDRTGRQDLRRSGAAGDAAVASGVPRGRDRRRAPGRSIAARCSVVKPGPVDCAGLPPSEKTWSWLATVPPLDEVVVPPTVIATYSVPSTE